MIVCVIVFFFERGVRMAVVTLSCGALRGASSKNLSGTTATFGSEQNLPVQPLIMEAILAIFDQTNFLQRSRLVCCVRPVTCYLYVGDQGSILHRVSECQYKLGQVRLHQTAKSGRLRPGEPHY